MTDDRTTLARRASSARLIIGLSILTGAVLLGWEVAYDLSGLGFAHAGDAWNAADVLDGVVGFAAAVALATWTAALVRVAHEGGAGADGALTPAASGWIVFLFPLTLHLPYLLFRRAARAVRAPRLGRLAAWTYAAHAVSLATLGVTFHVFGAYEAVGPAPLARAALTSVSWTVILMPLALEILLVVRFSRAALSFRLEDAFD